MPTSPINIVQVHNNYIIMMKLPDKVKCSGQFEISLVHVVAIMFKSQATKFNKESRMVQIDFGLYIIGKFKLK